MRIAIACTILIFIASACNTNSPVLFKAISAEESGISFSNSITENSMINMLNYEYLYNGGGVGIGDFNHDGMPDIYFTASLSGNKLYLNRGNFHFEDITAQAGVGGDKRWCRGVAIVDINNDGLLDMYVCASTWQNPEQRKNLLYINQGFKGNSGLPFFKDMAAVYGLADTTSTHMANFFDYDNDGDLDVYLLVNDLNQERPNTFRTPRNDGSGPTTDRLYRNDYNPTLKHPYFTNVSKKAGITWEGYGLGVNVLDINKDGWKDVLVSNDYLSGDILYINNKNGTFTNRVQQYFKHTSLNAMGNDAGDINNDGLVDIIETDMAAEDNYRSKMMMNPVDYNWYLYTKQFGFPYQTVRNTLQINMGPAITEGDSLTNPYFSETGYYSGIAFTDWSWAPLLLDADQDGFKDLMVTNGLPKDITDLDFIAYRDQNSNLKPEDLLQKLPAVQLSNYIYHNNGDATFTDKTTQWGWDMPTFSSGIAYADFDGDGDMDVVINNTNMPASILENTINQQKNPPNFLRIQLQGDSSNRNAIGATADIFYKGNHQQAEYSPFRGYMSTMEQVLHFGTGNTTIIDSLVITWPDGKKTVQQQVNTNQTLLINYATSQKQNGIIPSALATGNWFSNITSKTGLGFLHEQNDFVDFNSQRLIPHKFTAYGPAIAAADVNADGLDDIITAGGTKQPPLLFIQKADGKFGIQLFTQLMQQQQTEDGGICIFDADNDKDPDVYITKSGYALAKGNTAYADKFYLNDGKGNFVADTLAIPALLGSKSCVKAADIDADGDLDLLVGGRVIPGEYPKPESGYLLVNNSSNGKVQFSLATQSLAPDLENIGMITDAVFSDIDNDNDPDLIITGEWMGIRFFTNNNGHFTPLETPAGKAIGWWNSISAADIDNDGDMDFIAGNYGLNGLYKASETEPVNLYAKDYDGNNGFDVLLSFKRAVTPHGEKEEFPAASRDQLAEQMPLIKKQFNNYSLYGKATMNDVLKPLNRDNELHLSATNFTSSWIENKGNNEFVIHALPAQAQWSPVYGIVAKDFNADGNIDIALNGNEFSMSPDLGRNDALNGLLLAGDGKGNFTVLNAAESGIYIPGNGKGLLTLNINQQTAIVGAQNQGPLQAFRNNNTAKNIPLQPQETMAVFTLQNGKKRKEEFYFGSSFLSQSARFVQLNTSVKMVQLYNGSVLTRTIQNQ
jgi:enediyne biosynthesis protein E4